MGSHIPDFETEPQEPASLDGPPTLVDGELEAPQIPTPSSDLSEGATLDLSLPSSPENAVFASWDESQEFFVGPQIVKPDESPMLRRKVRWITIALVASIAAQVGGFAGDRLVPAIVEHAWAAEVTYQRVFKSGRSIQNARRLGLSVTAEVERLQREAEQAAFAGDDELARSKIDELNRRWSLGDGE